MAEALIAKLEHFVRLSLADRAALANLGERVRRLGRHEQLLDEGDALGSTFLVLEGWAFRSKQLVDGRRQLIGFLLPGDFCGAGFSPVRNSDHTISSLTPLKLAEVPRGQLEPMLDQHPRLRQALNWDSYVSLSIQREWTVNLGQRDALERLAHLLCELFVRLRMSGLTLGNTCVFPLTQVELADATGLSAVHVNRVLQELRALKLITLSERTLSVLDLDRLMQTAMFETNYLHLDREGAQWDAHE